MDVGALTPPLWGFEEREELMIFYERARGAACTRPISAPAASIRTCRQALVDDIYDWLRTASPSCSTTSKSLVTDNRIFKQRNVDIGVVSRSRTRSTGASPA